MRKKLLFSILFVIMATLIIIPLVSHGLYWHGLIWCKKSVPHACQHEVAHYVDEVLGFPSASPEFREAAESIGLFFWNAPVEVYAELYTIVQGQEENMPEQLREFYDWDLAEKLLAKYEID